MDQKKLYRLFYLPKQIEHTRREIQRIKERLTAISPSLTGMPHGGGVYDKIGEGVPELVDKKAQLERMVHGYEAEENEIERWIDEIEDLHLQLIVRLRFKDKMSWQEVAMEAGGNNTEDSVRKLVDRYIRKQEDEDDGL